MKAKMEIDFCSGELMKEQGIRCWCQSTSLWDNYWKIRTRFTYKLRFYILKTRTRKSKWSHFFFLFFSVDIDDGEGNRFSSSLRFYFIGQDLFPFPRHNCCIRDPKGEGWGPSTQLASANLETINCQHHCPLVAFFTQSKKYFYILTLFVSELFLCFHVKLFVWFSLIG